MLGKDRHHLSGISEEFLAKYGASDSLGQKAREAEAERLIKHANSYETEVLHREQMIAGIENSIQRMMAEHRLQMDYLVSFGVRAEHRDALRNVLQEVMQHKRLTPRQAVDLANSRARFPDQSSNGFVDGESVGSDAA